MPNSLQPHRLQLARLLCPPVSPGVCSDSCPLSSDAIQPSHPLLTRVSNGGLRLICLCGARVIFKFQFCFLVAYPFIFVLSVMAFQCLVNFCWRAAWTNYTYTFSPSLGHPFHPPSHHPGHHRAPLSITEHHWASLSIPQHPAEFPVLHSSLPLTVYVTYSSQLIGKGPVAGKDWRQNEKTAVDTMRWLDSITDSLDMNPRKPRKCRTGRLGCLGSQRIGHGLAPESTDTHLYQCSSPNSSHPLLQIFKHTFSGQFSSSS